MGGFGTFGRPMSSPKLELELELELKAGAGAGARRPLAGKWSASIVFPTPLADQARLLGSV